MILICRCSKISKKFFRELLFDAPCKGLFTTTINCDCATQVFTTCDATSIRLRPRNWHVSFFAVYYIQGAWGDENIFAVLYVTLLWALHIVI